MTNGVEGKRYSPRNQNYVPPLGNIDSYINNLLGLDQSRPRSRPSSLTQRAPVAGGEDSYYDFIHTASFAELMARRPEICLGDYGSGKTTFSLRATEQCLNPADDTFPVRIDDSASLVPHWNDSPWNPPPAVGEITAKLKDQVMYKLLTGLMLHSLDTLVALNTPARMQLGDKQLLEEELFETVIAVAGKIGNESSWRINLAEYVDIGSIIGGYNRPGFLRLYTQANPEGRKKLVDRLLQSDSGFYSQQPEAAKKLTKEALTKYLGANGKLSAQALFEAINEFDQYST